MNTTQEEALTQAINNLAEVCRTIIKAMPARVEAEINGVSERTVFRARAERKNAELIYSPKRQRSARK